MATRLETIGAQELINALARAERLGYHINDVVKKKPGPGGETVIPSISTLLTSLPPMLPHHIHGGGPSPPMPPPGPPQQSQPYQVSQSQHPAPLVVNRTNTLQRPSTASQAPPVATPNGKTSQPTRDLTSGISYCGMCHRPCSSSDALSYVSVSFSHTLCQEMRYSQRNSTRKRPSAKAPEHLGTFLWIHAFIAAANLKVQAASHITQEVTSVDSTARQSGCK